MGNRLIAQFFFIIDRLEDFVVLSVSEGSKCFKKHKLFLVN